MADDETSDILTLTTEIVASFVGNKGRLKAEEIPELIRSVRAALSDTSGPKAEVPPETPKASKSQINKSITPDALISFIDGKAYKALKRHLTRHGHDMTSYRAAYGLPNDYPSVAATYSAARSALAKSLGLGGKGRGRKTVASEPTVAKQAGGRKKAPKA